MHLKFSRTRFAYCWECYHVDCPPNLWS